MNNQWRILRNKTITINSHLMEYSIPKLIWVFRSWSNFIIFGASLISALAVSVCKRNPLFSFCFYEVTIYFIKQDNDLSKTSSFPLWDPDLLHAEARNPEIYLDPPQGWQATKHLTLPQYYLPRLMSKKLTLKQRCELSLAHWYEIGTYQFFLYFHLRNKDEKKSLTLSNFYFIIFYCLIFSRKA